jgi:hypothetical protein
MQSGNEKYVNRVLGKANGKWRGINGSYLLAKWRG